MIKRSQYKFREFQKELSNGKLVIDFHKVKRAGFPINLLMTERGSNGKTLNSKLFSRDEFLVDKRPFIFLTNSIPQTKKAKSDFFEDLKKQFVIEEQIKNNEDVDFWNYCKIKGDVESNECWIKYKGIPFIKIMSLNHGELLKGSRLHWKGIIWDEFNVSFQTVRDAITKFDSMMHSMEDLVANHNSVSDLLLFIFGNNKSLNNPIIYGLGVTHILDEITEYYDENGNKLMLVIAPQFDEIKTQQVLEENKNNWIFQMSKKLGTFEHSYLNKTLEDEINNIKEYKSLKQLLPVFSIHHNKEFINLYKDRSTKCYHVVKVNKNQTLKTFAMNRRDIIESVTYKPIWRNELQKFLSADKITFDNIVTRELFIKTLVK